MPILLFSDSSQNDPESEISRGKFYNMFMQAIPTQTEEHRQTAISAKVPGPETSVPQTVSLQTLMLAYLFMTFRF